MGRIHAPYVIFGLVALGGAARAEPRARPFVVNAWLGAGIEPHDRAPAECSRQLMQSGTTTEMGVPQCNLVVTFGVSGAVLWRGLVGLGLGLYAAEGSPIQVMGNDGQGRPLPSFGDRVSVTVAAVVRPLAPLAWRTPRYWTHLASGLGLELGGSVEHARTALESATQLGLHLGLLLDVPVYGTPMSGGLALRLSARALVSPEARFGLQQAGNYQVVEPGSALQLFAGLAYSLE